MAPDENFSHGDMVWMGSSTYRVHAPRWWDLPAHLTWLLACRRRAATRIRLSTGHELRLTAWVHGARPLRAFAHEVWRDFRRWFLGE